MVSKCALSVIKKFLIPHYEASDLRPKNPFPPPPKKEMIRSPYIPFIDKT
jgi:hypothetical protein